jgi:antitoxin component of MazEF toxin-antitoxin module
MGFSTKIQLIKRKASEQWYVNLPSAVAQAMEFEKGEVVEWVVEDKYKMTLKRVQPRMQESKKKLNKELS